jgi:hypothetical protein
LKAEPGQVTLASILDLPVVKVAASLAKIGQDTADTTALEEEIRNFELEVRTRRDGFAPSGADFVRLRFSYASQEFQ